jgi:hypothetical protein
MVFQHESEKLGFSITIFICKSPKFSWAMASQRQPRHHYCRTVAFRRSRARGADDICCELGPPGTKGGVPEKNMRYIFSTTVDLSRIKENHFRNLLKVPNLPHFRPVFWLCKGITRINIGTFMAQKLHLRVLKLLLKKK